MKINRLTITNFRGVTSAEVTFPSVGVTVIEGDNEAGKSSLAEALSIYPDITLHLAAPPSLEMPPYLVDHLTRSGVKVHVHERLEDVTHEVDILYVTRIQRERMPDEMEYERVRGAYRLTAEMLKGVRPGLRVLHPLPRVDEIAPCVDETPYAYYFQQAAGGVHVRKALLWLILTGGSK